MKGSSRIIETLAEIELVISRYLLGLLKFSDINILRTKPSYNLVYI